MSNEDREATQFAALRRAVDAGCRKLVRGRMLLFALTLLLGGAGASVLWRRQDPSSIVRALLLIGGPLSMLAFVSYSARNAWEPRDGTISSLLELEIERRRDWIRRMTFVGVFAVVILATGLIRVWLIARAGQSGPSAGRLALSILLVAWILWQAGVRRERFERERTQLAEELASEPRERRGAAAALRMSA